MSLAPSLPISLPGLSWPFLGSFTDLMNACSHPSILSWPAGPWHLLGLIHKGSWQKWIQLLLPSGTHLPSGPVGGGGVTGRLGIQDQPSQLPRLTRKCV